jgi:hypothetical protein
MLRKSVEQQVRLAYAKVPQEAAPLHQARLDIRASLVSSGFLTVEELESLTKEEAVTAAVRRLRADARRVAGITRCPESERQRVPVIKG